MATAMKIVLINDANSQHGRHWVQLNGGIYENCTVGQIVMANLKPELWVIKGDEEGEDGEPRAFKTPMGAALVCAAEYIEVNEVLDNSPSAHKIR